MTMKKDEPFNPSSRRALYERLDWNLFRIFTVIVQEESITKAATRLCVTQSAVSQSLRRFEEQVGCKLMVRNGNTLTLTGVGEKLYNISTSIYEEVRRVEDAVESNTISVNGRIKISMISGFRSHDYDVFLGDFHKKYPNVSLDIEICSASEVIMATVQKRSSLGIGLIKPGYKNIEYKVLLPQRYAFYCSNKHRFFGKTNLVLEDMLGEDFVAFTADQIGFPLSSIAFFRDSRGFTGRIVASSPNVYEIKRLISAGIGIGCLPDHIAQLDVENGHLWKLPPHEGIVDANIVMIWNNKAQRSSAEQIFIDELKGKFNNLELKVVV